MIEPVPLASADSADCRAVSADFSPLTWAFHWPWAALARLSSSVCAVFSSAVSVLSVLAFSFTWMMSVAVTRSAATSAHTAASGEGARYDTLGPADGPADEDAAEDGVLLGPHAAASSATPAMVTVSATARRGTKLMLMKPGFPGAIPPHWVTAQKSPWHSRDLAPNPPPRRPEALAGRLTLGSARMSRWVAAPRPGGTTPGRAAAGSAGPGGWPAS